MPQALRAMIKWENFNLPVSYKINAQNRMRDARNVFSSQDILQTRHGIQRFNSTAISSSEIKSITFFKKTDGTKKYLAKAGTALYDAKESGASPIVKSGLSTSAKHRSVTMQDRAIIAIEDDGLFSYDGTTFTQLGQTPPLSPTVAISGSGNGLAAGDYQVANTFESSTTGFETNIGTSSSIVTITATGEQIDVTGMQASAANATIDKINTYLRVVGGEWFFWSQQSLGATTDTINDEITSSQTPPTGNAPPRTGGGKFLAVFGKRLIYAGSNDFPDDVFFSEPYIPDGFDQSSTGLIIKANGNGPVTGLGVGFFNDSALAPYLCIFKRRSIELYSELGGQSIATISTNVGCISHDTIQQIDGDLYFQSENGWHIIREGKLVLKNDKAFKLGDGDIDAIYTEPGFDYELNKQNFDNFFSVYYPTLNQYMTFVAEAGGLEFRKAYNYEILLGGFRPYSFQIDFNGATLAEDSNDEELVLLAGPEGYLYKHSINVSRHDVDVNDSTVNIDVFAQLYWIAHDDLDSTMNFGTLIFKGVDSDFDVTVKCFLDYKTDSPKDKDYNFDSGGVGFILDVSKLDEGVFSDSRTITRDVGGGIQCTSQALLIGFYQNDLDANIGLISGQLDASKNGNPN